MTDPRRPAQRAIRIGNSSGFYGDRGAASREMVEGGPIDVLTGDYLAELTMLILWKAQQKDPGAGYARSVLGQLEEVLGTCLDHGIKIVNNAGGLNPAGLAAQLAALAERLGLHPKIAYVTGDDLLPRLDELTAAGHRLGHLDTGLPPARPPGGRAGAPTTSTPWPARCWPATSSSADPRPPGATTRSWMRSATAATQASRSPRSPPTAAAGSPN